MSFLQHNARTLPRRAGPNKLLFTLTSNMRPELFFWADWEVIYGYSTSSIAEVDFTKSLCNLQLKLHPNKNNKKKRVNRIFN
jgi:hypothetical protein